MMQCKHDICLNKKINLAKIRKCWLKRKNIAQLSNKGLYNSPIIIRYNTMETNFNKEQICFHDEPDKTNISDDSDDILNTD